MNKKIIIATLPVLLICVLIQLDSCKPTKHKPTIKYRTVRFSGNAVFTIAGKPKTLNLMSVDLYDKHNAFWFELGEGTQTATDYYPIWNFHISDIWRVLGKQQMYFIDTCSVPNNMPYAFCSYFGGQDDSPLDLYYITKEGPISFVEIDSQKNNFAEMWGHFNCRFKVEGQNSDKYFPDTFSCIGTFHALPLDSFEWLGK